jgi:exopolysaccharide production protein ExoQ
LIVVVSSLVGFEVMGRDMHSQAILARQRGTQSPAPRRAPSGLFYTASVLFILESMGTLGFLDKLLYGPGWIGRTGSSLTHGIYLLSLVTGIYLFWRGAYKPARFRFALPIAIASTLLISAAWSADPRTGLSQGVLYVTTVLGAIGMAQLWEGDALLDLAGKICALCALASLLALPSPGEDFQGIFSHKNVLGAAMALGVLAGLHTMRVKRGSQLRCLLMVGVCAAVAVMSKSMTSVMIVIVFVMMDLVGRLYMQGGSARTASKGLAFLLLCILIFFVVNQDDLLELLGKDPTLTGRTLFWPYVIDCIFDRPFLGWGYFGFWTGFNPIAMQISEAIKPSDTWYVWVIPNAHNGLLEALLEVGFVGTSLFFLLLLRNFVISVRCLNGPAGHIGLSLMMLTVGICLDGVSEVVMLVAQHVWTVFFFMLGFLCEKNLQLAGPGKDVRLLAKSTYGRLKFHGRLG